MSEPISVHEMLEGRAARKLGLQEVPVMVADGWTDVQKQAYVLADNKLALNAGWDSELLGIELAELQELGTDLSSHVAIKRAAKAKHCVIVA